VTQVLDGRQEEGLFGPLRNEEGDELGLGPDVLDDVEDGLAGRALGGDDVNLFVVDEGVAQEPDPVALPDASPGAAGRLRDLVVEAEAVPNLERKNGLLVTSCLRRNLISCACQHLH
jgi:hypothetical protein